MAQTADPVAPVCPIGLLHVELIVYGSLVAVVGVRSNRVVQKIVQTGAPGATRVCPALRCPAPRWVLCWQARCDHNFRVLLFVLA